MRKISDKVKAYKQKWAKDKRKRTNKAGAYRSRKNLIGQTFGRLTVIDQAETKNGATYWVCRCECGNLKTVVRFSLTQKNVQSCGCLKTDVLLERNTIHGDCGSKEFTAWVQMRQRCYNTNNPGYPRWGGRGIIVCERWLNSYENFLEDMGRCPFEDYSLDRINNNLNYDKENCRWASEEVQANNKRNNCPITYNGETLNVSQWARRLNINQRAFYKKMSKEKVIEKFYNKVA